MKKAPVIVLLSFLTLLVIASCKKDANKYGNTIYGKWRLAGSYISSGGPQYYVPVTDKNDYVIFNANGTLSGTTFKDYQTFVLKDSVTVTLTKADGMTYENYRYLVKKDTLKMSPSGPIVCIEGCSTVLVR